MFPKPKDADWHKTEDEHRMEAAEGAPTKGFSIGRPPLFLNQYSFRLDLLFYFFFVFFLHLFIRISARIFW